MSPRSYPISDPMLGALLNIGSDVATGLSDIGSDVRTLVNIGSDVAWELSDIGSDVRDGTPTSDLMSPWGYPTSDPMWETTPKHRIRCRPGAIRHRIRCVRRPLNIGSDVARALSDIGSDVRDGPDIRSDVARCCSTSHLMSKWAPEHRIRCRPGAIRHRIRCGRRPLNIGSDVARCSSTSHLMSKSSPEHRIRCRPRVIRHQIRCERCS